MNLLNLQLPKNHFHTLLPFAQNKAHNVYTNWHGTTSYENACGIYTLTEEDNTFVNSAPTPHKLIAYVDKFIDYYNIDILQVAAPEMAYLHTYFKDKVLYIGPTKEAARLETNKIFAKEIANKVGVKTPAIIRQGKYTDSDYCSNLTFPTIEKPAYHWDSAINIFNEEDAQAAIDWRTLLYDEHGDREYFIEEYIDDMIETNVFFVIANGEYRITHTQEIIGENLNKTVKQKVWYLDSYIKPLKPEVDTIVRKEADKYLKEITKLGGSYEGSFCGAYTSTGEWYFLEINVRPDIYNSTPIFMTGEDYIKGMFEDISLFDKAWEHQSCDKYLCFNKDAQEEYPFHLHQKYDVSIPNNLELINGKFFVHPPARYTSEGDGVCTIVADHNIPTAFIEEVENTTTWTFNKDPINTQVCKLSDEYLNNE